MGTLQMQIKQGPASSVGFRGRRPGARNGGEPTVRSSDEGFKASERQSDHIGLWQPRCRRDLIETALSAMQATGQTAWAALSTSGLRTLELPASVRDVVVL